MSKGEAMILDQIIRDRKESIKELKSSISIMNLQSEIEYQNYSHYSLESGLRKGVNKGVNIVAEVKRASPSKGIIAQSFPYIDIAMDYEKGGAAAISVLTEPNYFKGDNTYLTKIKDKVNIPILRKDFIVDEWQIYESKTIGADAILLIASALSKSQIKEYLSLAKSLGLEALVETHSEDEIEVALDIGASIIGINNRNLKTFDVSLENTNKLKKLIPDDKICISESGINTREDIVRLEEIGCDAALIGESLMRAKDRQYHLRYLRGER